MDLFFSGLLSPKPSFDAAREIPSLAGKVILVTGGTAGLGRETVLAFAAHAPAHIFFTGRSQSSADSLMADVATAFPSVAITFLPCDLASFASIRSAAQKFLATPTTQSPSQSETATGPQLHILMANAGVMGVPPGLTREGYDAHFGTNHVGHALLAHLLLPALTAATTAAGSSGSDGHGEAGGARIVWMTSLGYQAAPAEGIRFASVREADAGLTLPGLGMWQRYGQSKLANLLYARKFAEKHPDIASVSVHPGVSVTGLVLGLSRAQRLLVYASNVGNMLPPEQCAWNQQWAATAALGNGDREVVSGVYYEPVARKGVLKKKAGDDQLAEELWVWTQKEIEKGLVET